MDDNPLREFCQRIPKIELHAHLNGCIRSTTFRQLLDSSNEQNRLDELEQTFPFGDTHTRMINVFEKFALLRSCVKSLDDIRRITRETLEDFIVDGVFYVELRTRPRTLENGQISSSQYIECILETMKQFENQIHSRLILSIDRTQTIEQAMETFQLTQQYRSSIVGLDFSGDPNVKSFERFRSIFDLARENHLSTTIHIGELPDDECLKENDLILDYHPTRLGHFNYRTDQQEQKILEKKIPLELCPTSNMLTMNLSQMDKHHFYRFYSQQHPLVICTDDSGLMNCSLSSEYFEIAQTFQLTREQIWKFLYQTCNLIFDKNLIDVCRMKLKTFAEQQSNLF